METAGVLWAQCTCFRPAGLRPLVQRDTPHPPGCWGETEPRLPPGPAGPLLPSSPGACPAALYSSGRGTSAARAALPSQCPILPVAALGLCSVCFKKHHLLASVFGWLACDKHLSTSCISEYLFFFIDRVVNNFLRGKIEGKMVTR